jgi:hypothetical protein
MVRQFDTFFQLIASGTAVMETLATGIEEMVTFYSTDTAE